MRQIVVKVSYDAGPDTEGNRPLTDVEVAFGGVLDAINRFKGEMRDQGIHVGIGTPAVCCTCGRAWPCGEVNA